MALTVSLRALEDEALRKVGEISGENVYKCMQCGTCSAVCPMTDSMTVTTRGVMALLQHGFTEQVLASQTPWLCASCHQCEVRCPRGIDVPRLMEAVRLLSLRTNADQLNPRDLSAEALDEMPQVLLVSGFRKLTA